LPCQASEIFISEVKNMFRKFLSLTLVALLFNVAGAVREVRAGARVVERTRNVGKVRENVRLIGRGDEARLELKLWDGRKLKVYLDGAGEEDDFAHVDMTSSTTRESRAAVAQFKGGNLLDAAEMGLALAKGAAIAGAMALGFNLIGLALI
jgi:hypothetical protein